MKGTPSGTPPFWRILAAVVNLLAGIGALALGGMILVTCLDVVLRRFGVAFKGAYDLVRVFGALALSCALPATTAARGHIAIEYFVHKLNPWRRRFAGRLVHGGMVGGLTLASWRCVLAGSTFLRTGEVTPTLQLPLFWLPWFMALGCLLSALSSLFHLWHPGREMARL